MRRGRFCSWLGAVSIWAVPLMAQGGEHGVSFWGEGALYRRSEGNQHRLIIHEKGGTLDSCGVCRLGGCSSRTLVHKFGDEVGWRVGMAYTTPHTAWEATYLWLQEWSSCCQENSPGKLFLSTRRPAIAEGFPNADVGHACYSSDFKNGELNFFRYSTPHRRSLFAVAWLAGLRYIYLTEELMMGLTQRRNLATYTVNVWNRIPALQVGGNLALNPTKSLSWDLMVKVGVGYDLARQHTHVTAFNGIISIRNHTRSGIATPFLTDVSLSLTYQPWSWLNARAAYQMIYLNGVALAPDQLNQRASRGDSLRTIGSPIIYGWTAGAAFIF